MLVVVLVLPCCTSQQVTTTMSMSIAAEKKLTMSLEDLISAEKGANRQTNNTSRRERSPRGNRDYNNDRAGKFAKAFNVEPQSARNDKWKDWKSDDWSNWKSNDRSSSNWKDESSGGRSWKDNNKRDWDKDGKMVKVTNIPYDLTWHDVKDAFKAVGQVDRCELDKGTAWVTFADSRDAVAAVKSYDGGDMNGRTIKVTIV